MQTDMQPLPLEKPAKRRQTLKSSLSFARQLLLTLAAALLFTTLIAAPVRVSGSSMVNTLRDKDFMIVTKIDYLLGDPSRFDVVICHYPNRDRETFVKRIVGVPGDVVEVRRGALYVNGEAIDEPYIEYPANYTFGAVTLPEDQYFVLGDNRASSNDSHLVGPLTRGQIVGRVRFVFWPLSRFGKVF